MAPPPSTARYGLLARLHGFRRDLRVAGNPALGWSAAEHGGRVLGLFCFDARFLARPDFSVDGFAFFLATLKALRDELRALGGDLLVLYADASNAAFHVARPTMPSGSRPISRCRAMHACRDCRP
jgi:deoxyribodipyrimidine photolyase